MKNIAKYIFLSIVVLIGIISCKFDHLYYETSLKVLVRIDVDWSKTFLNPNGVSAYAYDADGRLYAQELSSNPDCIFLKLPKGTYNIVIHNNSISEIRGVGIENLSEFKRATAFAITNSKKPAISVKGDENQRLVTEPDDMASYTLRGVEISDVDVNYHYYKPDLSDYEQECTHIYSATPLHIVHRAKVIMHIGGLQYAAGVPTGILRGMSGGYGFNMEREIDEDVMEQFKVNTRVTKSDDNKDAKDEIFVEYNTFGMHTVDSISQKYYLDVTFNLIDGSTKSYHVDVSDSISTTYKPTHKIHTVELELESLPEAEGGGEKPDPGEGNYDPSLDDWLDVEVDLPM